MTKEYLAVVEGTVTRAMKLSDHIVKQSEQVRIVGPTVKAAKHAQLSFEPIKTKNGLTLLHVTLQTGRPHQIRLQLSHQGWPILGDFRYGAKRELDGKNLALHSRRITVSHPVKKEKMQWVTPVPDSWPVEFRRSS